MHVAYNDSSTERNMRRVGRGGGQLVSKCDNMRNRKSGRDDHEYDSTDREYIEPGLEQLRTKLDPTQGGDRE